MLRLHQVLRLWVGHSRGSASDVAFVLDLGVEGECCRAELVPLGLCPFSIHTVLCRCVGDPPAICVLWPVRAWSTTGVPPQRARLLVATSVSGIWYLVSVVFYSSGIE